MFCSRQAQSPPAVDAGLANPKSSFKGGGASTRGWVTAQGIQRWGNRESLWEPLTTASAGAEANFLGARASTKSSKCRAASRGNVGKLGRLNFKERLHAKFC